jgi:hypothetical protein
MVFEKVNTYYKNPDDVAVTRKKNHENLCCNENQATHLTVGWIERLDNLKNETFLYGGGLAYKSNDIKLSFFLDINGVYRIAF